MNVSCECYFCYSTNTVKIASVFTNTLNGTNEKLMISEDDLMLFLRRSYMTTADVLFITVGEKKH